ncbi:MAG: TauD/TfdA family dioxygenase [Cyanobacteria bacterium J06592_8]
MRIQSKRYQISEIQQDTRKLFLDWADGHRSTFHYLWLRDNCYCSKCGDPRHGEKRFRIIDVPLDIEPLSVRWDSNTLEITWKPDSHKSIYNAGWLRQHCYSAKEREHRQHRPILWDNQIVTRLPEIPYQEVINGNSGRLQLLENLRDYGICFVRNMPPQKGELESFAKSFGPLLETNYGRVFEIVVDPEECSQKNVAHSRKDLIPHMDDTYQSAPPGIIFFHCLMANNDGSGQSTFVDGFQIAEVLRQEDYEAFDLLCHYEFSCRKNTSDRIDMQFSSPIFCLDSDGNVNKVGINNIYPAPLDLPEEIIEPFYAAYRKLMQLYTDPRYCLKQGLQPGDLVMFDNHRVLHGRTAIGIQNQRRHLRHCSVDRDYFQSWQRLLHKNSAF